jgi:regulator of RNase E activity RraA
MTNPGFRILPRIHTSPSLVALFEGLPTSIISDAMNRLTGTHGLVARHRPGTVAMGSALTVRVRSGDNLMIHKALQLARPGDMLVIDGSGVTDRALIGDIMKNVARARGVVGAVVDGAIRDSASFRDDDFGCWSRGVTHRGPHKDGPGEINVAVCIDGNVVEPGHIVVGDDDGVVFVAPAQAEAVAAMARRRATDEAATLAAIARGAYDDAWIDQALRAKGVLPA